MGKIGDLWVKLGLKKQEFDRGMDNAEKRSEGFGSKLGKLKGIGVAVWAAIGGAVLKVGADIVKSTNQMEDKWGMFVTKAKAGWQTFIRTLTNGDWSNFFENFKREVNAAAALQEVLDADTEIMNSIRIQKAQMADELARLEVVMRDTTRSYKDRADAAQQYLNKVLPIYDKEIQRAEALKAAQYKAFLGGRYSDWIYRHKPNQATWDMALVEYGNLDPIINGRTFNEIIGRYLNPESHITPFAVSETKHAQELQAVIGEYGQLVTWFVNKFNEKFAGQFVADYDATYELLSTFFNQYEKNRNSEEAQALVDSVVGLEEAESAMNEETKRVQTTLAAMSAEAAKASQELISLREPLEALAGIEGKAELMNLPDIIPDDWLERNREKIDEALAEVKRLQDITDEINSQFENAVVYSLSGATQALADTIAGIEGMDAKQVLASLLQPFGDTMISLGEMLLAEGLGIEAFKESLKSLNGGVAIAAGLGLIALGSALSSGIRALADGGGSTSTGSYTGGSSTADVQNYTSELTIYVEGRISGSDIVLAGNKTINKWRR